MEISMFNNCIKLSVASLYVWVLMFLSSYSYAQSDTFTITEDTVVDSESNPYEEADITVDGATIYLIGDYSFGNMELVNGASIEIPHDYQGSEPYIKISSRDFYLSSDSVVDVSGASYLVIPPGMPRTPEEIDFRAPEIPGSAGMTREIVVASTEPPREYENQEVRSLGGGVFVLTGRDVELHGEVAADAENIIESTGDGGSGGSIFIEGLSIKLGDNASLTAVGSPAGGLESYYGWGGDGGHVSLISGYIEGNPDSAVNVSGGRGDRNAYNPGGSGATGTLYFYENLLDIEDPEYLIIRNKRELSEYENLRAREVSVDYEGFDNIAVRNCPVRIVTGVGSEYIKVGGLIVFDGTVA